jgi:hypothetical protein
MLASPRLASPRLASPNASGILVPVVEKSSFEFKRLGGGTSYETVVRAAVDVRGYSIVHLLTRVHAVNIGPSASLDILLRDVDPSDEDGLDFVISSPFLTSTAVTSATTAPRLTKDSPAAGTYPGPFLRVIVRATQAPSSVNLTATISADLLLRAGVGN